jgi:hypothetical protein
LEDYRCSYCRVPLAPFNLLENDTHWQIVFANAELEPGLSQHGLRCTENRSHTFGFRYGAFVEIDYHLTKLYVNPPNPSFEERANDWLANIFLQRLRWVPFPRSFWIWVLDQVLYPWQIAGGWYAAYDPNAGELTPEEAAIIADIAADRLGEDGGPYDQENVSIFPYEDESGDWTDEDDDWERRQEEQDTWDAEDDDPDAWADYRADQEDRDHGTHFPEEGDDGRWHDGWNDDPEEGTDEDPESESESESGPAKEK